MKTFTQKPAEVDKKWVIIDATDLVRRPSRHHYRQLLRGKNKVTYTPHVD